MSIGRSEEYSSDLYMNYGHKKKTLRVSLSLLVYRFQTQSLPHTATCHRLTRRLSLISILTLRSESVVCSLAECVSCLAASLRFVLALDS